MTSKYLTPEAAEERLAALVRRLVREANEASSMLVARDRLDRLPPSLRRRVVAAMVDPHLRRAPTSPPTLRLVATSAGPATAR